jgi:signal transduction histidine kinase
MRVPPTTELLRQLPLFAELPQEDLDFLCREAGRQRIPGDHMLIREGEPGDALYVLLEGEVEVTRRDGRSELVLARRGPGEFIGEMALLEGGKRSASVRACGEVEVLVIGQEAFRKLLARPVASATLLRTMASRLRSTEAVLMQREKLASLGGLAAGLAHELNNPAAAIERAVVQLDGALREWRSNDRLLGTMDAGGDSLPIEDLDALVDESQAVRWQAIESSVEESDLSEWLEDRGVHEPWMCAPVLVQYGFSRERLAGLEELVSARALPDVIRWLASGLEVRQILTAVRTSAHAISDLVGAVRTYARLDQAPIQKVDVRESLEDTMAIVKHKLGEGIEVVRDFPPELPVIDAYASELNQVWTNLIDNALDAMGGTGTLTLRVEVGDKSIDTFVEDDGAGIPDDVASRVFDPFFTSKPPGEGTGLGLHIAYNIVVDRHRGTLSFESRPGRTIFRVSLPMVIPP